MKTVKIDDEFGGYIEVPLWEVIIITILPPVLMLIIGIVVKYMWSKI